MIFVNRLSTIEKYSTKISRVEQINFLRCTSPQPQPGAMENLYL